MIEILAETGSTNAELARRLTSGEAPREGDWLIADRQSAGRGRQGRAWHGGAGNFMGSALVGLRAGDPPAGTLALVAGLAVLEVVSARLPAHSRAMLKWPNDVLIGRAKLAGILLERIGEAVIVGIGVNLASAPELPDRETVALSHYGPAPARDSFAADLADVFAAAVERWRSHGLGPVVAGWQAAGHPPGTPLSVGEPGEPALSGTFAGLSEDGALRLALPDGTTRTINAGEVRLG